MIATNAEPATVIIGLAVPLARTGAHATCTRAGHRVLASCATGPPLLQACTELRPEVVVTESSLLTGMTTWPPDGLDPKVVLVTDDVEPHELAAAVGRVSVVAGSGADSHHAPTRLTPREVDVLRLVALGYSNERIADTLHLGLTTVKTNLRHVNEKLETSSRTGAAMRATALGLVSA